MDPKACFKQLVADSEEAVQAKHDSSPLNRKERRRQEREDRKLRKANPELWAFDVETDVLD